MPVRIAVCEQLKRVALLLVDAPENDVQKTENYQANDALPFPGRKRRFLEIGFLGASQLIFGEVRLPPQIQKQPGHHAYARGAEAVLPTPHLTERSTDQRRKERAQIDAHVEDGEGAIAARIARRVKASNLSGNIGLEASVA